jgi:hypothetical protein
MYNRTHLILEGCERCAAVLKAATSYNKAV